MSCLLLVGGLALLAMQRPGGVTFGATFAIPIVGAVGVWKTWPFRVSSVARRYARSNGGGA